MSGVIKDALFFIQFLINQSPKRVQAQWGISALRFIFRFPRPRTSCTAKVSPGEPAKLN